MDVAEVVSADDSGPLHFHLGCHARLDAPSDEDITSVGVFLVSVGDLNGLPGRLETQTGVLVVSW